jgi:hypothetical protein
LNDWFRAPPSITPEKLYNAICNLVSAPKHIPLQIRICMKDFDIHKINRKLELVIKRIKNSDISKQDKKVILEFYDYAFSIGLSKKQI